MRTGRMVCAIIGLTAFVWGQAPPEQPKFVQKMIEVKFADVGRIARLVNAPGLSIKSDDALHALVVYGTADAVAAVETMVRKLDVSPANVELTVYLLSGSMQSAAEDLPKELAAAAKQLHAIFAYKGYRITDSFVLRNRDGRPASTSGSLPAGASYDFRYNSSTVSSGTPRVVHLDNVQLVLRTPTPNRDKDGRPITANSVITTDIDVGEGQKIVVGKSSINGSDDALILVVTAKVVE